MTFYYWIFLISSCLLIAVAGNYYINWLERNNQQSDE